MNPQKKYNNFLKYLREKCHSDVSSPYSHNKQLYLPNTLGLITFRHLSPSIHETSSMHVSLHKAIPQLPLYNAPTYLLFTYSDYYQVTVRKHQFLIFMPSDKKRFAIAIDGLHVQFCNTAGTMIYLRFDNTKHNWHQMYQNH